MFETRNRHLFHRFVVFTDRIGKAPAPVLILLVAALAASAGWIWNQAAHDPVMGSVAGLVLAVFISSDWLMLAWLPRAGRSFGPVGFALLAFAVMRWTLSTAVALIPASSAMPHWTGALALIGNLALTGNVLYSLWAEPFQLGVTRIKITSPKLAGLPPLRVLHLSDLHVERITPREHQLLELVDELRPDLIVFTGDFLNLSYTHDERAQADCREVFSRLRAPMGVYAISGSPSVDPQPVVNKLLDGLDIQRLDNQVEPLKMAEDDDEPTLALVGVTCTNSATRDSETLHQVMAGVPNNPSTPFTLLLYHTPDLVPQAVHEQVDLYLCGHTHGGQIRLPLIGALVTSSKYWKRYEMGYYIEGNTTLYVSRGIGMEGRGAPRARFLCPPEIELFELRSPD